MSTWGLSSYLHSGISPVARLDNLLNVRFPFRTCEGIELRCSRFEKSLYDLIRGLRNHKGNQREYIQQCLRQCRIEIRGPDMDLKATALLKLIYLEMFGHDMSWASFHVLEVMSSQKYPQKRVGYLAAVQSFRPDTEVLMLATNLLKKVGQQNCKSFSLLCSTNYRTFLHLYRLPSRYHSSQCLIS